MKQMWDKKEIETLIDEHGGGGSGAKWGQITGTLSDQTDLKNALDAKQDTIDSSHKLSVSLVDGLAAVATSGDYDDLINKPDALTIDEKTIITDAETGDIKTAIGGYVIDNSIEHTTVLPFDEGYYALYNTPENATLYNLFNSLEVNQHFDIYFEKSSDGETWEADSHNPIDCYIVSKDPQNNEVQVYNDDVYDNSFTCTDTMIEVGWFGDFEDDTYIRMRIVIGDVEIEEIDGRVIPVDGTTITLNSSNELQGFSGDYNDLTNKPVIPDPTNIVFTNTDQVISGSKTFTSPIRLRNNTDSPTIAAPGGNDAQWGIDFRISNNGVSFNSLRFYDNLSNSAFLYPWTDSHIDLGQSARRFKNLYIAGSISNGTNSVSVANIATLNTAQEFTANKTFNGELNIKAGANDGNPVKIYKTGNYLKFYMTNFDRLSFYATELRPEIDEGFYLGSNNNRFGGVYTTNISDGTTNLLVANIASKSEIPDIYYKDGDKFKNLNYLQLYGYLTNGGKDIQITVILPKLLTNIASITVNKISMITRGVSGYVGNTSYTDYAADTTNYTITSVISAENAISITIRANSAWSGGQNNTPVCAVINNALGSLELTFNEA